MFKKFLSFALIGLILNLALYSTARASVNLEKEAKFTEKVKINIAKLGTGEKARIEVKLKDGTKLKGYISEITDTSFVVTDAKTGAATPVAYSNAKQVKGNNLSKGVRIAIAVGIILAISAVLALISLSGDSSR
jgi:hypothetical protein